MLKEDVVEKAKDKTAITFFVLTILFGIWLCLMSSAYKLGNDLQTMWLTGLSCFILNLKWLNRKEDTRYCALAVIPIALRYVFNLLMFSSWNMFTELLFALQVIGVWVIVAFGEENFRATMTTFSKIVTENVKSNMVKRYETFIQDCIAVGSWLIYHFVQKAFFWEYFLWLLITGFILQFILRKGGLGSAVLAHFVINLTA